MPATTPSTIVASITREWQKRMGLIVLFVLASAGWFFYDGIVGYPKQAERALEFQRFTTEGRVQEWPAYANSRGWKREDPGKPKTAKDFRQQKLIGIFCVAAGVVLLGWIIASSRRAMRMENGVIRPPFGQPVPLDAIKEVSRKKWKNKGIAYAFHDVGGSRKRLTIDDYKYGGAEQILIEIEKRLGISRPEAAESAGQEPGG